MQPQQKIHIELQDYIYTMQRPNAKSTAVEQLSLVMTMNCSPTHVGLQDTL